MEPITPQIQKSWLREAGFSLIELLAVLAIISIISVLAIPALNGISGAYSVTRQGQLINDQLTLARQMATSRNRDMELRFIESPAGNETNWAIQIWQLGPAGQPPVPTGRRQAFSDNLILNPSLSPLITSLDSTNEGSESWRALRFRPNGRIAGQIATTNSYLTVQLRSENATNPRNFFTLQINPITGRIVTYRP